ncbi:MAG: C69 family dipeptidase [Candidatus Aminicenantes bacterium]|nr:C69 family dipeptidase [Candidatus Aminicenantes bacterium]
MVRQKEWEFESCTSIIVGKGATVDGSTMTSHSCDSGSDRTWINIVPHQKHKKGDMCKIYFEPKRIKGPDHPDRFPLGEIPQVEETYAYINTAYPVMNEHQLAIGETTFGGRRELMNKKGLIDAPELYRLILERARTAREAIRLADDLTKKHGYRDYGECFTFADPEEVWFFEILGPGKDRIGAVWAAQRIPDDHIGVSANASRIRQIDLGDKEHFMASENVFSLAEEMGWWDPQSGEPFEFCYAYAPQTRTSIYCRRREWRVLSLAAPSLDLNPHSENFPFSVKPEKKLSVQDIQAFFRDYYQDTPFDMSRSMTAVNRKGETVLSPVASPFLNRDWLYLLRIPRERTICVGYATYVQITQSRSWLPDPIGGVVWLGYDNPAATPQIPFYCGITRMPDSYRVGGREGFRRDCAWWAFRRVSKLALFRWQDMIKNINAVRERIENAIFGEREQVENRALELYKQDPVKAAEYLTEYCLKTAEKAVEDYWNLGDELWTRYARYF